VGTDTSIIVRGLLSHIDGPTFQLLATALRGLLRTFRIRLLLLHIFVVDFIVMLLIFLSFLVQNKIIDSLRIPHHLQRGFWWRYATVAILMQDFLWYSLSGNDRRRLAASIASTGRIESVTCSGVLMVKLYLVVFCAAYHMAIILNMLFLLLLLDESLITDKGDFHVGFTADVVIHLDLSIVKGLRGVFDASIVNRIITLLVLHLIVQSRSPIIRRLYAIMPSNLLQHFLVLFYSEILISDWWSFVSFDLFRYEGLLDR